MNIINKWCNNQDSTCNKLRSMRTKFNHHRSQRRLELHGSKLDINWCLIRNCCGWHEDVPVFANTVARFLKIRVLTKDVLVDVVERVEAFLNIAVDSFSCSVLDEVKIVIHVEIICIVLWSPPEIQKFSVWFYHQICVGVWRFRHVDCFLFEFDVGDIEIIQCWGPTSARLSSKHRCVAILFKSIVAYFSFCKISNLSDFKIRIVWIAW